MYVIYRVAAIGLSMSLCDVERHFCLRKMVYIKFTHQSKSTRGL